MDLFLATQLEISILQHFSFYKNGSFLKILTSLFSKWVGIRKHDKEACQNRRCRHDRPPRGAVPRSLSQNPRQSNRACHHRPWIRLIQRQDPMHDRFSQNSHTRTPGRMPQGQMSTPSQVAVECVQGCVGEGVREL